MLNRLILAAVILAAGLGSAQAGGALEPGCWLTPWGNSACLADNEPMVPLWKVDDQYCHYTRRHDKYDSHYTYYRECEKDRHREEHNCRPVCTQYDDDGNCLHYYNPCQQ